MSRPFRLNSVNMALTNFEFKPINPSISQKLYVYLRLIKINLDESGALKLKLTWPLAEADSRAALVICLWSLVTGCLVLDSLRIRL